MMRFFMVFRWTIWLRSANMITFARELRLPMSSRSSSRTWTWKYCNIGEHFVCQSRQEKPTGSGSESLREGIPKELQDVCCSQRYSRGKARSYAPSIALGASLDSSVGAVGSVFCSHFVTRGRFKCWNCWIMK